VVLIAIAVAADMFPYHRSMSVGACVCPIDTLPALVIFFRTNWPADAVESRIILPLVVVIKSGVWLPDPIDCASTIMFAPEAEIVPFELSCPVVVISVLAPVEEMLWQNTEVGALKLPMITLPAPLIS